jgi:2-dehydropantoate 2-reductase
MNITVFGAGSIGSLFAGRMAYSGYKISVIGRDPHITEITRNGLRIIEHEQEILSHFPASTDLQQETITQTAIMVTTKAYDNTIVANSLRGKITEENPILILQNGMGNENVFRQTFPHNPIFRAITTEASELIHPGIVKHIAFGRTSFGIISGRENGRGKELQGIMNDSGFTTKITPNIKLKMWQKLLTNAIICPLAALLHVPNGKILQKPSIQRIFDEILREGLELAQHNLPDEDFSTTRDYILNVIDKTKNNKCSMLQDIERGRRTEIDFLNGFIVKESQRIGIKAPINAAIADLIRHIEKYPE